MTARNESVKFPWYPCKEIVVSIKKSATLPILDNRNRQNYAKLLVLHSTWWLINTRIIYRRV